MFYVNSNSYNQIYVFNASASMLLLLYLNNQPLSITTVVARKTVVIQSISHMQLILLK